MTTINSLSSREIFSIASDLDDVQNHLRITHDMVLDQLCEGSLSDLASMEKMHERLFLLIGGIPVKLAEMAALNEKLMEMSRKEPAAA